MKTDQVLHHWNMNVQKFMRLGRAGMMAVLVRAAERAIVNHQAISKFYGGTWEHNHVQAALDRYCQLIDQMADIIRANRPPPPHVPDFQI